MKKKSCETVDPLSDSSKHRCLLPVKLWTNCCCHHSFVSQENNKTESTVLLSHLTPRRWLLSSRHYWEALTVFAFFLFCPFDAGGWLLPATVYCCCINLTNQQDTKTFCRRNTLEDLICLEKCSQTSACLYAFFFFWKLFFCKKKFTTSEFF